MASVIETFLILFQSDADEAADDIGELNETLDDTEVSANSAADSFVNMGKSALGAVAGVFALSAIVGGLLVKTDQLDQLQKFSDLVGENIGEVDAWGQAVIRSGGSAEGFQQSLKSLNEKLIDASIKGTNEIVPFFNQLGISIVDSTGKAKSSIATMIELRGAFERISKQESAGIGQKLGLDDSTIRLLQTGGEEFDKLIKRMKSLGVASKESAEASATFNDHLADLRQISGFASSELLISVLPAINGFLAVLTDVAMWMTENSDLVTGFFIGLAVLALPAILSMTVALGGMAIAVIAATWPFLLVAGVIAVLYEDIKAFVEGNDSLIGRLVKKWGWFGDMIKLVKLGIKLFVNEMKAWAKEIGDFFDAPMKKINAIGSAIKGFFGFGGDDEEAGSSSIGAQTSGSISNSTSNRSKSTSVQTGDIVIHTQATDANGIAQDAAGAVKEQMTTMVQSFDDGVLA